MKAPIFESPRGIPHDFRAHISREWLKIPLEELRWEDVPKELTIGDVLVIHCLRLMPYEQYLRTDHWREVRRAILRRDRFQCRCGGAAIDVHHNLGYKNKGFELPADLLSQCRPCHTTFHETWLLQAKESLK